MMRGALAPEGMNLAPSIQRMIRHQILTTPKLLPTPRRIRPPPENHPPQSNPSGRNTAVPQIQTPRRDTPKLSPHFQLMPAQSDALSHPCSSNVPGAFNVRAITALNAHCTSSGVTPLWQHATIYFIRQQVKRSTPVCQRPPHRRKAPIRRNHPLLDRRISRRPLSLRRHHRLPASVLIAHRL